jgi:hypothetical protein
MLLANKDKRNSCTSGQNLRETGSSNAADIFPLNESIAFSVSGAENGTCYEERL